MITNTTGRTRRILLSLPPICYFPERARAAATTRLILAIHFTILASFYSLFFFVALLEGTLIIAEGIGVLQNEPFFIHFVAAMLSVPIISIMAKRVSNLSSQAEAAPIISALLDALEDSKFGRFLYWSAALVGLLALAYTIVMSVSDEIDIYDSVRHLFSFATYFLIRIYLYFFCYPFIVVSPVLVVIYLFKSLHASSIPYRPFHPDGLGGLRPFLVAVDRPIYAVQTIAVLIAIMNYLGWGGLEFVPSILAIAAPLLVTILAVLLFSLFYKTLADKKQREVHKLQYQQSALYEKLNSPSQTIEEDMSSLVGEIEAMARLMDLIRRRKGKYWIKYALNLTPVLLPQIPKFIKLPVIIRIIESIQEIFLEFYYNFAS